ncbi:ABC transporter ATP-binding protein [Paenibacillus athensensis]|nr:ABC transporter ATP-binding protein [Paenibacillus athensensis]MCD1257630.1 ABC transporter ATP-binding protein [Paenibacillus athensensis]
MKLIWHQTRLTLAVMTRMLGLLFRQTPWTMLLLSVVQIAAAGIPVGQIYVTMALVQRAERVLQEGMSQLEPALIVLLIQLLLLLLQVVLEVAGELLVSRIKIAALLYFGQEVAAKSARLSLLHFEQHEFFDLLQRVSSGLEHRGLQFFQSFLQILKSVVTIGGFFVVLFGFHWLLACGVLLFIVPSVYVDIKESSFKVAQVMRQTPVKRRASYLTSLLSEREWAKEVRIFGLSDYFLNQWRTYILRNGEEQLQLERKMSLFKIAVNAITLVIMTLIGGLLLRLTATGAMTIAGFVALLQTIFSVQASLKLTASYMAGIYEESLYTNDLFQFLAMKEEEPVSASELPALPLPAHISQGISVSGLSFGYPGRDHAALQDISFEVAAGETIAIVGENGAGKSTLIKCLLGLYPATGGTITYDGVPLERVDPNELREHVTAIFQDFVQYHLTLRENIGLGRIEWLHDEARLQTAAAQSGVDEFLDELPGGLDTELGYKFFGGHELSYGQWQKVAISRAFFRDSDILVFDEPTSALDPLAEAQLFERIAELSAGKTAFFISHRLGICRAADRILVLKDGTLHEQGSHEELMKLDGVYAHMFRTQAEWYQ